MVMMMNGSAFFLNANKKPENNLQPVDMKIQMEVAKFRFSPKISAIRENAFVATQKDLSFCEPKLNKCTKIEGYKGVDALYSFHAY